MEFQRKIKFENSGYYLLGLVLLVLLGFWDSYFSKLLSHTNEFNIYFHFHAGIAFLWILMVIIQPFLIKRGYLHLHRKIGKLSYPLIVLVVISVVLLLHSRLSVEDEFLGLSLLIPFKDILILGVTYLIGIWSRKTTPIHARAMIATGIVFIEPSLLRILRNYFEVGDPYLVTAGILYLTLLLLTILTWKHKKGRWVFPFVLLMYVPFHLAFMFRVQFNLLDNLAKWFINIPIT